MPLGPCSRPDGSLGNRPRRENQEHGRRKAFSCWTDECRRARANRDDAEQYQAVIRPEDRHIVQRFTAGRSKELVFGRISHCPAGWFHPLVRGKRQVVREHQTAKLSISSASSLIFPTASKPKTNAHSNSAIVDCRSSPRWRASHRS